MSGMDFLLSDFAADGFVFVASDESIPSFPSSSKLSKDSKPSFFGATSSRLWLNTPVTELLLS
jgi:hypothetical protein